MLALVRILLANGVRIVEKSVDKVQNPQAPPRTPPLSLELGGVEKIVELWRQV